MRFYDVTSWSYVNLDDPVDLLIVVVKYLVVTLSTSVGKRVRLVQRS